jgi:hypothetical protein
VLFKQGIELLLPHARPFLNLSLFFRIGHVHTVLVLPLPTADPYPSSYLLNGKGMLPAYPVAAACKYFEDPELDGMPLLG